MPLDTNRNQRVNNVGTDFNGKLEAMALIRENSAKLGHSLTGYLYVDDEEVRVKTEGAALQLLSSGSNLAPGKDMTVHIPFIRWKFDRDAFHILSREPSTAANPIPVFQESIFEGEDLQPFIGLMADLQGIA